MNTVNQRHREAAQAHDDARAAARAKMERDFRRIQAARKTTSKQVALPRHLTYRQKLLLVNLSSDATPEQYGL